MSCEKVRPLIASLIDRQLQAGAAVETREEAMAHLAACRACGAEFEAAQWQRVALRSLGASAVPAKLAANLRVMASHERAIPYRGAPPARCQLPGARGAWMRELAGRTLPT